MSRICLFATLAGMRILHRYPRSRQRALLPDQFPTPRDPTTIEESYSRQSVGANEEQPDEQMNLVGKMRGKGMQQNPRATQAGQFKSSVFLD